MNVQGPTFFPIPASGQELTVEAVVVQAAALPDKATHALLVPKTQDLHVSFGEDPAPSGAGCLLKVGEHYIWGKSALAHARFVRAGGSSGVLSIVPGTL